MELQEREAFEQMGAGKGLSANEREVGVERGREVTARGDLEGFREGFV